MHGLLGIPVSLGIGLVYLKYQLDRYPHSLFLPNEVQLLPNSLVVVLVLLLHFPDVVKAV